LNHHLLQLFLPRPQAQLAQALQVVAGARGQVLAEGGHRLRGAVAVGAELAGEDPAQVVGVEAQLLDEDVGAVRLELQRPTAVDVVHHLLERALAREVGQVGPGADGDARLGHLRP